MIALTAVESLTIFVEANFGDEDSTAISSIKLMGTTVHTTNMKDFKRVSGEAGERE